jgi:hypothetical protein
VLRSVLREQTLTEEGLRTLLCEIESILNDRPITKTSDDPSDLEALSPNHILLLKRTPNLSPGLFTKDDNYARRRWKQVQYMTDLFWKRWSKEYIPQLQERQKWAYQNKNIEVGDLVLIIDDSAPRNSWPMARVMDTLPDRHRLVRKVRVKTKTNTLERPITKLVVLLEADNAN